MEDYNKEFYYDSQEDVDLLISNLEEFIEFGKEYKVKGVNVGWRNKSGVAELSFNSVENFFNKVIPNTSFDLILYTSEDKGFMIELYHHDSPTGERHYFYPK